jgi:hypothetical protein
MIVEHVFVTTLEPTDAFHQAASLLAPRGFYYAPEAALQPGSATIEFHRPARTTVTHAALKHPQSIRLEYDRGRITLAAAATLPEASPYASFATSKKLSASQIAQVADLLTEIARSLETLLVHPTDPAQAAAGWDRLEAQYETDATATRRRSHRTVVIALGVVAGIAAAVLVIALAR